MKKFLVIFAVVALIASPAMAAEWNFYGSARMSTFSTDVEVPEGAESDQDTNWNLQGNSRIGANVKAGDVTGRFEYGSGPNLRLLYGEWNFGAGSLLVGQAYTPANFFPSNQVYAGDQDLLPTGGIYAGRDAMIQLKFGGFKLAFVEPGSAVAPEGTDLDITYPRLEASYRFKTDMFYVDVVGGYQTYEFSAGQTWDVDSYLYGVNLGLTFGPAKIMGSVYGGQNMGQYGWGFGVTGGLDPEDDFVVANNEVVDTDEVGFLAVINFKANDMLSFETGYGYRETENDTWVENDNVWSWYGNAVITFAPGVFVVPEIGVIDGDKFIDGTEEGNLVYWGAKWQINF